MAFDENVPVAANQITADLTAMNANWEFLISGDGTAGRVLRRTTLEISDATTATEIKLQTYDIWNGDANAAQDDLGKGETQGVFTLNGDGDVITIEATGLTGNCVSVLATEIYYNDCETSLTVHGGATANDIVLSFWGEPDASSAIDLTTLVDTGVSPMIRLSITYLTDA